MKKILLSAIALLTFISLNGYAQWTTTGTSDITNTNTGKVGIGTTTPLEKLDVSGNAHVAGFMYSFNLPAYKISDPFTNGTGWLQGYNAAVSSSTATTLYSAASTAAKYGGDGIHWYTNSYLAAGTAMTERMVLDLNGRLGIGITTPSMALEADIGSVPYLVLSGSRIGFGSGSSTWATRFGAGVVQSYNSSFNFGAVGDVGTSEDLKFVTQNASDLVGLERMRIAANGNVGIGNNNPSFLLDLKNNGSVTPGIAIGNGTGNYLIGTGVTAGNANDFGIADINAGATRLMVNSAGNVGIGTTTPVSRLTLAGTNAMNPNTGSEIDYEGETLSFQNLHAGTLPFTIGSIKMVQAPTYFIDAGDMVFSTSYGGSTEKMRLTASGRLGVGTTTPNGKLSVVGKTDATYGGQTVIDDNGGFNPIFAQYKWIGAGSSFCQTTISNSISSAGSMDFQLGGGAGAAIGNDAQTTRMTILPSGNVGIGTTNPDELLSVKGTIHTKEVKVDLNVPGPDYVFDKTYELKSLHELKSYIAQNKHLPEVPSAEQMQKDGLKVGEFNILLLKKTEELTMYLIEKDQQLEAQKKQITQQEERLKKLEALLNVK